MPNDAAGNDAARNDVACNDVACNDAARNDAARNDAARNDVACNDVACNDVACNDAGRNDAARNARKRVAARSAASFLEERGSASQNLPFGPRGAGGPIAVPAGVERHTALTPSGKPRHIDGCNVRGHTTKSRLFRSAPRVLTLVIGVEFAGFGRTPPGFVLAIPRHGLREALQKVDLRCPA